METKLRSLLKTLSWRTSALFITACVTYSVTGGWKAALALGTTDTLVKLLLFYLHERAWNVVPFGRQSLASNEHVAVTEALAAPRAAAGASR
jgi:uncharacterized membrane protein